MQQNVLGTFLRERREQSTLSQNDVAKELGYSTAQYISNFERGVCQPSLKIISQLAKIYKVNLNDLFEVVMEQQRIEVARVLFKGKSSPAAKAKKSAAKISVRRRG